MNIDYSAGQTPLDPDEMQGLIPSHITTQSDLNEWEQANIMDALNWVSSKRNVDVLSESFCIELHKRMFGRTWKWAGTFRHSDKNIGVDWQHIPIKLRNLLDDARYWFEKEVYSADEAGMRFHHRLVLIHPFPNGNGRHARLMTDALLVSHKASKFTWGGNNLLGNDEPRRAYLAALRAADAGNFALLVNFVRS